MRDIGTTTVARSGKPGGLIWVAMSHHTDDSEADGADKRQPRQSRLVKATLVCDRFGPFDVTLRNVSENGIGGQSPHPLVIGERMTILLPGHPPMTGIVRWVSDRRFGIETVERIEPVRLRAAHADQLTTADNSAGFEIVPAPKGTSWRPGLKLGAANPADRYRSNWQDGHRKPG